MAAPNHTDPARLVVLLILMSLGLVAAQVGLVSVAFHRLGLSAGSAMMLLLVSLIGSVLNVPVLRLRTGPMPDPSLLPPPLDLLWRMNRWEHDGHTVVAVNVGGALIPVVFSGYLLSHHALHPGEVALAISAVTAVSFYFSRPVFGVGIAMPVLVAPLAAALAAVIINPFDAAPLAYIGGTVGVLLGADLFRLRNIRNLGAPLASIGGAGTFDGIYLTGLVAVLLS